MKQNLQSVMEPMPWHPDAEQLTAFAEQALPPHEREQTLAHLAVCRECREAVFLAQQAGAVEVPQPAPARRPWFAGWNLAWPAVAALAAFAGFIVYLFQGTKVEHPVPPIAVAVAQREQPLPVPETQHAAQAKKRLPAAAAGIPAKLPAPPPPVLAGEAQFHGALARPKPAIVLSPALAGQGTSQQAAAAPVNMSPQAQSQTQSQAQSQVQSAFAADGSFPPSQAARQTTQLRVQAPQDAPIAATEAPPPPLPQPVQQNEVVTAAGIADSLSDIPATSDSSAKFAALLPELPSHQEMVSSISNGMATVAVDAQGAVFESRDEGKHWKTVEAQWAGRPVKVALDESRSAKKRSLFRARSIVPQVADDAPDRRPSGVVGQAELHGTVTDQSGAAIPGAKVQVRADGAAGDGRTAQADAQGRFAVPGLAAGRYQVVVSSPGFATLTRVLSLDAGVETGMNATLVVGAMTETVTVESNEPGPKIPVKAKAPAFQLTTDTGAVWVSSDGRSWKRR